MPRDLPNLDWVRVFVSAAASESFATAASELGVTPGAVSQRVKALEAHLGVELFRRHARGVTLTDVGARYFQRVSPLVERLAAAAPIRPSPKRKLVRLTILPALTQLWLGPRMHEFHVLHPEITVEISADLAVIDLETSDYDLALRYGRPPFAGRDHIPLFVDELVPVAAPSLAKACRLDGQGLPIGVPLLLDTYWTHDFEVWLGEGGGSLKRVPAMQAFSLYSMVVEAAVNGRGFAIGHTSLVSDHVAAGRLLSQRRVLAERQFFLLRRAGAPLSDAAAAFSDWLTATAQPLAARRGTAAPRLPAAAPQSRFF
jgi:LysR family transcriptional regulator, glycine cleavage system transcriptional activator